MRRTPLLLIALALLGFAVAGCGGGGSSTEGSFPTTTEATLGPTTEAVTTEAFTTEAATEAQTTTAVSGAGLASAQECRELLDLNARLAAAQTGTGAVADMQKAAVILQAFADKAPGAIRDDFRVYADYVARIADAYKGVKPGSVPDHEAIAKLQKIATEIDPKKVNVALRRILAWLQKNCAR